MKNIKNLLAALMLASTAFGSLSAAGAALTPEERAAYYAKQMAEIKREHDERLAMNAEEQRQKTTEAQAAAAAEEQRRLAEERAAAVARADAEAAQQAARSYAAGHGLGGGGLSTTLEAGSSAGYEDVRAAIPAHEDVLNVGPAPHNVDDNFERDTARAVAASLAAPAAPAVPAATRSQITETQEAANKALRQAALKLNIEGMQAALTSGADINSLPVENYEELEGFLPRSFYQARNEYDKRNALEWAFWGPRQHQWRSHRDIMLDIPGHQMAAVCWLLEHEARLTATPGSAQVERYIAMIHNSTNPIEFFRLFIQHDAIPGCTAELQAAFKEYQDRKLFEEVCRACNQIDDENKIILALAAALEADVSINQECGQIGNTYYPRGVTPLSLVLSRPEADRPVVTATTTYHCNIFSLAETARLRALKQKWVGLLLDAGATRPVVQHLDKSPWFPSFYTWNSRDGKKIAFLIKMGALVLAGRAAIANDAAGAATLTPAEELTRILCSRAPLCALMRVVELLNI